MGKRISMETQNEILKVVQERYQCADKENKTKILDEFVNISGYHRKHAIRLILKDEKQNKASRAGRKIYDEAVNQALVIIWEAADRICGKRMRAIIPRLIESMEDHGHLNLDDQVRKRLLQISAATIDRLLAPIREPTRQGMKRKRSKAHLGHKIIVRTYADWGDPMPGYFECDFVAHCGGVLKGSFIHTLVLTDIASGWTDFYPLIAREQNMVLTALDRIRNQIPIDILGLDTDNDSAFINEVLIEYCRNNRIEFTRSRPYRKNDQAWIEQKNGAVIRRQIGYGRYEGMQTAQIFLKLYEALRLYINYFQPSFKLLNKVREGSKETKKYLPPATPCDRILDHAQVKTEVKEELLRKRSDLDPVKLLMTIRECQKELVSIENLTQKPSELNKSVDIKDFLSSLSYLWHQGDVRPTHQKQKRKTCIHDWQTRPDPFVTVRTELMQWFETEPDITAKELFERLQTRYPNKFEDGQLRTLQRIVKVWRGKIAQKLLGISVE